MIYFLALAILWALVATIAAIAFAAKYDEERLLHKSSGASYEHCTRFIIYLQDEIEKYLREGGEDTKTQALVRTGWCEMRDIAEAKNGQARAAE